MDDLSDPRTDEPIERLGRERQNFFLPFYIDVVAQHPGGIGAPEVKEIVRDEIERQFGFDPFDAAVSDTNLSTGDSRASQWANNLVSNHVLDQYLLVERGARRVTLYPVEAEHAASTEIFAHQQKFEASVDEDLRTSADDRRPVLALSSESREFLRSPALAVWVKREANYECLVQTTDCVSFVAKDGFPYIEVHHLIPMAEQIRTTYNLDRTANMVALCPACHLKLHRGAYNVALDTLERALSRYRELRGLDLKDALSGCDLGSNISSLLSYYGQSC